MSDAPDMTKANDVCVGPQSKEAGKADGCKGCPNATLCASGAAQGEDPDIKLLKERMDEIQHKVLVLSGKGGVGKSTMTKELGLMMGRMGLEIGLMDTDICGPSLPRLTGARSEEIHTSNDGWEPVAVDDNVHLISVQYLLDNASDAVIFRGPRKNGLIKNFMKEVAWGALDVLLVDTPPGTSDEHLSIVSYFRQSGGCDGAIVVTTPQEVAVSDVRRELNFCRKSGIKVLGIVENMSGYICPSCKKGSEIFPSKPGVLSPGERLAEEFAVPFLGKVPLDPSLMAACERGEPLEDFITANAQEAGKEPVMPPSVLALQGIAGKVLKSIGVDVKG